MNSIIIAGYIVGALVKRAENQQLLGGHPLVRIAPTYVALFEGSPS
jgi:hypothetical protein